VVELSTDRLQEASAWSVRQWTEHLDDLGGERSAAVGWTPRRTVDHLIDTAFLYSAYVARRATARLPPPRNGDPSLVGSDLVDALVSGMAILVSTLDGMDDGERAFHPSGLADRSGWIGMACTEVLVHTADAVPGAAADPAMDPLAGQVVDRVLPWAPGDYPGWDRLLWATGRADLGHRPPEPDDWWWQSAPLREWDGQPRRRTAPPQW
jgi:hypothetical protein